MERRQHQSVCTSRPSLLCGSLLRGVLGKRHVSPLSIDVEKSSETDLANIYATLTHVCMIHQATNPVPMIAM